MMKSVGIRKVHYTDNNGDIVSETVKDMFSIQSSSVTRFINQLNSEKRITNVQYFEGLLKELLPTSIRKTNFEQFVKHNMSNVLPKHTYVVENSSGKTIVTIFNSRNIKVVSTNLTN
jgi:hypothetical protein